MAEEQENINRVSSYISTQDSSFLQYRLNTDPVVQQIEIALSGRVINYMIHPQTGEVVEHVKTLSSPKVNDEGFTAIVNYVKVHVNNQTVQGNLDEYRYSNMIADIREDFSMICMINLYKWDIRNSDYQYIVDSIMDVIKLFLSRTIGNKERESYNTMKTDTNVSRSQRGWGIK